jgi:hypothetical protein
MKIKIMETDLRRLRDMAGDFEIEMPAGASVADMHVAIASAHRRAVYEETRPALPRKKFVQRKNIAGVDGDFDATRC